MKNRNTKANDVNLIFMAKSTDFCGMDIFWNHTFLRAYDSAYDSDFRFSLGHKHSYDSGYDSDSVTIKNQTYSTTFIFQLLKIKIII